MNTAMYVFLAIVSLMAIGYAIYWRLAKKTKETQAQPNPYEIFTTLIEVLDGKRQLIEELLRFDRTEPGTDAIIKQVAIEIKKEVAASPGIPQYIKNLVAEMPIENMIKILGKTIELQITNIQNNIQMKAVGVSDAPTVNEEVYGEGQPFFSPAWLTCDEIPEAAIALYTSMVYKKRKLITEVPEEIRPNVLKELNELGLDANGEPLPKQ